MTNMNIVKKKEDLIVTIGKKKMKFRNAHVSGYESKFKTNFYKYIEISYHDKDYKKDIFKNVKATRELDYLIFSGRI